MSLFSIFFRKFISHFSRLSWSIVFFIALTHLVVGYAICIIAEQAHLIESWHTYFHFWLVTISTVGYGDYYAQGHWQKILVDIWFIGFGLGLFGSLLGKAAEFIFQSISKHVQGMKQFNYLTDHIVVFCDQRSEGVQIIDLILADKNRQDRTILLCSTDPDIQHPYPDSDIVEYARLDSFMSASEMERINLKCADRVIINTATDNANLALTLHVSGFVSRDCHIVSHFDDQSHIDALHRLKIRVECSTSKRVEQLVRASQDHGSTAVINRLLDTNQGMSLFVIEVNNLTTTFGELKGKLYKEHRADLMGISFDELGKKLTLLPEADTSLKHDKLFLHYLSKVRLNVSCF